MLCPHVEPGGTQGEAHALEESIMLTSRWCRLLRIRNRDSGRRGEHLSVALLSLAVLFGGQAAAQPDPGADGPPDEEITVRGRKPLSQYRIELEEARQDVIRIYNDINSSDDNDIRCKDEAPTGTRMRQRVCRSAAQSRADAAAARNFLNSLLYTSGNFFSQGPTPEAGGAQINALVGAAEARTDGALTTEMSRALIDKELKELQRTSRRLYRAVVKYLDLAEEYENARREISE